MNVPIETSKVFNVKYLLTAIIISVIIAMVLSWIMPTQVVLYDDAGNVVGRGLIKPTLKNPVKLK